MYEILNIKLNVNSSDHFKLPFPVFVFGCIIGRRAAAPFVNIKPLRKFFIFSDFGNPEIADICKPYIITLFVLVFGDK